MSVFQWEMISSYLRCNSKAQIQKTDSEVYRAQVTQYYCYLWLSTHFFMVQWHNLAQKLQREVATFLS